MRRDGTEAPDGLRKDDTMTMEILVARSIRTGGPRNDPLRLPPPEGDLLECVPNPTAPQAGTPREVSPKQ